MKYIIGILLLICATTTQSMGIVGGTDSPANCGAGRYKDTDDNCLYCSDINFANNYSYTPPTDANVQQVTWTSDGDDWKTCKWQAKCNHGYYLESGDTSQCTTLTMHNCLKTECTEWTDTSGHYCNTPVYTHQINSDKTNPPSKPDKETCKQCDPGTYCKDLKQYTCPMGGTSIDGATSITDCYIAADKKICDSKNNCLSEANKELYYRTYSK